MGESEAAIVAALGANFQEEIIVPVTLISTADQVLASATDEKLLQARALWSRLHALYSVVQNLPPDDL